MMMIHGVANVNKYLKFILLVYLNHLVTGIAFILLRIAIIIVYGHFIVFIDFIDNDNDIGPIYIWWCFRNELQFFVSVGISLPTQK